VSPEALGRLEATSSRWRARMKLAGQIHHEDVFFREDGSSIRSLNDPYDCWRWTLRRLKVRYREPYNARHSSVSWNLMLGKNLLWVSKQRKREGRGPMDWGVARCVKLCHRGGTCVPTLFREGAPHRCGAASPATRRRLISGRTSSITLSSAITLPRAVSRRSSSCPIFSPLASQERYAHAPCPRLREPRAGSVGSRPIVI